MRQSQLFTNPLRLAPTDATSINAQLLERGGFVYKNSAGVYSYLPLGLRVIKKITDIIREEMNAIGGQEMLMPALVDKKYLNATGRGDVPVGYRVRGIGDTDEQFMLGWTHEEVLTEIATRYISSYKDLPFAAYQIQTKFRNESRAKSGILRGKEFIMKDLYSFHSSQADFEAYYKQAQGAYEKVFTRCGLDAVYTVAGGGAFTGSATHEFQVVSPVGEDIIFVCDACRYAINSELFNRGTSDTPQGRESDVHCGRVMIKKNAIEVGNIFPLGTKYSQAFNLSFTNAQGKRAPVIMGSYGIGVSRLMGTIVEIYHDEKGIMWPEAVAPFRVHLLDLTRPASPKASRGNPFIKELYEGLQKRGVAVLYDDRSSSAGDALMTADLLGIPWRAVVSDKTGDKVELKQRGSSETQLVHEKELYIL